MIILGKCVDIMVKTAYNNHRITKHYVFLEERRCDGALSLCLKSKNTSLVSVPNVHSNI